MFSCHLTYSTLKAFKITVVMIGMVVMIVLVMVPFHGDKNYHSKVHIPSRTKCSMNLSVTWPMRWKAPKAYASNFTSKARGGRQLFTWMLGRLVRIATTQFSVIMVIVKPVMRSRHSRA